MQNLVAAFLRRPLGKILALGVAYWFFGALALVCSIHPASPVPVWPASGLALVGLLLWGPSVWPGIFLGSMMVGLEDFRGAATLAERVDIVAVYAALGAAATVQGLVGRALVARHTGFPSPMDRLRFLTMLILAGPVACLINPTVGVAAFVLTGRLASGMGITWCLWWISDQVGVMAILIMVSAWMAEMGETPQRIRWIAVGSVLGVMVLVLGSFLIYRDWSRKVARGEFERHAALIGQRVRHQMVMNEDVLHSVERLIYSRGEVDRQAFHRFVHPFVRHHSGIQALAWVPKVAHGLRPLFESRAQADGLTAFGVTEQKGGTMVPAGDRELYYPVYYMEPLRGNERALGYDLGSNPSRMTAITRSLSLAEPTLSGPVVLVQEKEKQPGFLILVPVYSEETEAIAPDERLAALRGFALGVFRAGDMIMDALKSHDIRLTGGQLNDLDAPDGERLLWEKSPVNRADSLRIVGPVAPEFVCSEVIAFGGRRWQLSLWPMPAFADWKRNVPLWLSGVAGFMLGGALCAFLFTLLGRSEKLFRVNAILSQEVLERRAAEASLVRIQQRLAFILNTCPTVTFIARAEGNFGATFVSSNVVFLCGYTASQFTENPSFWADHIHNGDRERVLRESEGILVRGEMAADYRFHHANGTILWVHDQALLVRDDQGNPKEIIGSWSDITARKEAGFALKASEERFGAAFKCNPGAMAILSLADQTFIDVNDSFTEMFGLRWAETIDQTPHELRLFEGDRFFPEMMDHIKSAPDLAASKGAGRVFARETVFRKATGETGSCLFSSSVITIDQRPCLLIVLSDTTRQNRAEDEKRSLEKKLRQSQKLEAIGTLAGGIAHDFNNILSVIIGYSELAQEAATDPALRSDLCEVLRAGQRARDLIAQILAFSRQSEQEMRPIRLKLIVGEVLTLLKASLPSYIVIRQQIECDAMILGDPIQIHQVLMNLCTNAGHAMPDGGTLEVILKMSHHPALIAHPDQQGEACVELTIRDTGEGMTPEVLPRIFEPYFTTKKKGHGTGLGLSVVHGIVANHGGDIRVESTPGEGSTFHVYLPLLHDTEEETIQEIKAPPQGTEQILFVDDEPTLAEMAKRLLESLGYRVTIRTSSLEALELFKSQPDKFDLLITDMTMPHMTGEFLIEAVLRIRPGFPAIICTGFSERINEKKAKQFGALAYIFKPILKQEIAEIIRRVLDG